jgi:radical SAM/CxCxxxxC motif protein YfkAB
MRMFGTLHFYACGSNPEDLRLLERLYKSKSVTVRNDLDGRSRLNVNIFTGDIIVTDFGDIPELGNIQSTRLQDAYENWKNSNPAKEVSCNCPGVSCLSPNILVKNSYYQNKNFNIQRAKILK